MGGIKTFLHEVGQILIPAFSAYCDLQYVMRTVVQIIRTNQIMDDDNDKSYSQLELGWGVLQVEQSILNEVVDRTSFFLMEEIIHAKQSIDCLFDRFFRKMYSWMTLWKATKSDREVTSLET